MRTKPNTALHYRSVGSGQGRAEIGAAGDGIAPSAVQIQLAASETPLTQAENGGAGNSSTPQFLHFPTIVAAVSFFYNLPAGAITGGASLNLTACVLWGAEASTPLLTISPYFCRYIVNNIIAGASGFTSWNSPALLAINP